MPATEVPAEKTIQSFSKELINVQDIDRNDTENPQLVSEYVNDIYDYMRELESRYPIKYRYLEGSQINGRMRGILIDWLVQVHLRFHLLQETLYLTVAIIDRFLQVSFSPTDVFQDIIKSIIFVKNPLHQILYLSYYQSCLFN